VSAHGLVVADRVDERVEQHVDGRVDGRALEGRHVGERAAERVTEGDRVGGVWRVRELEAGRIVLVQLVGLICQGRRRNRDVGWVDTRVLESQRERR